MFFNTARPRDDEPKKTLLQRQLERDRAAAAQYDREQAEWRNGNDDDDGPIRLLMKYFGRID